VFVEPLDGLFVVHPEKGTGGCGKVGVDLSDELASDRISEDVFDRIANHALDVGEEVVKGDERELGLDVGVLCQMSARRARARDQLYRVGSG
jgi:hypothetical protein